MRRLLPVLVAALFLSCAGDPVPPSETAAVRTEPPIAIVIHGGAGTITRDSMTPEMEAAYRAALEEALRAGHAVLEGGGMALDAVIAAIQVMEESELFNAGRGAVFTSERTVELDAAIMNGADRNAGAVAGIRHVKSPIALARVVMERSEHVMMIGEGAETFAREQDLDFVENSYFYTERRLRQLEAAQARESATAVVTEPALSEGANRIGTVGAVALDRNGDIAAGTSTGGMTNKRFGRVGDVPVIGAGTYADNETAGISATGWGEYFIRGVVAHDIASQIRYAGRSLPEAADDVIMHRLGAMGGTGGVIALNREGTVVTRFNTEGMYRGWIDGEGELGTAIYADER